MEKYKMTDRAWDEEPFLDDEERNNSESSRQQPRQAKWAHLLPYSVVLNIVLLFSLFASLIVQKRNLKTAHIPGEIYSPARSAVEYETVVFSHTSRGEKSEFQGSSSDVDAVWDELYNGVLISQITAESAARLPNATTPFTDDTSHYIVELDVFHQLHCLNYLRKLVYPDVYKVDLTSDTEEAASNVYHMEHCYDQLRQSLQCSSDISTVFWEWSRTKQRMLGNVRTTHTCKNFEKIRNWALENKAHTDLDFFKYVEGAPIRQD